MKSWESSWVKAAHAETDRPLDPIQMDRPRFFEVTKFLNFSTLFRHLRMNSDQSHLIFLATLVSQLRGTRTTHCPEPSLCQPVFHPLALKSASLSHCYLGQKSCFSNSDLVEAMGRTCVICEIELGGLKDVQTNIPQRACTSGWVLYQGPLGCFRPPSRSATMDATSCSVYLLLHILCTTAQHSAVRTAIAVIAL